MYRSGHKIKRILATAFLCVPVLGISPVARAVEDADDKVLSGVIVNVDEKSSSIMIKSREGLGVELEVDSYTTVIWKEEDYVDSVKGLARGDLVEVGYFVEEDRTVAGWIDVLGQEEPGHSE